MTQYNTTQYNTKWHNTIQHDITQHNRTWHNTTRHDTIQHENETIIQKETYYETTDKPTPHIGTQCKNAYQHTIQLSSTQKKEKKKRRKKNQVALPNSNF